MNARVRPATLQDIDWIAAQLRVFSASYGTAKELFPDDEFARQWLTKMIQDHLLLVADGYKAHERIGFICGVVTPHLYNPMIRVLAELFWWVTPEHRGGPAGARLLDEFIAWGKINADWITFGTMNDTQVKEAALTKRGFVLKEKSYLMEVS